MSRFHIFILGGILIVAGILRFSQLGINPPALTWDEAAWGYNAYSLGIDGKDEFGRFLPLAYLESFGDFKPPVYAYLDIIPIKIFGLNEFAVRFPSALLGTGTVILTYFLVKELFPNSRKLEMRNLKLEISELAALILAVSPWHIMLSRAAFEANVASFFIICGVYLFFVAVRKNQWFLLFSVVAFILSLYTFNSARIVSPLLFLVLGAVFRKELCKEWKQTCIAGVLGIILLIPLAAFIFTPQAALRFREVNIFSNSEVVKQSNQEIAYDKNAWWSKVIHNRRWLYAQSFLQHYFDHFNPGYLFIKGDGNPKFSTQSVGELYLWDAPFLLIGFFLLFRKREGKWWFLLIWMVLGIIPAATARETPHALRTEAIIPTMQIITAYGVVQVIERIKTGKMIKAGYLFIVMGFSLLFFNVLYFLHGYYAHYPREYSGEWEYGYKESIAYVSSIASQYDGMYITEELGRPYIYYAFYLHIPPQEFRQQITVKRDVFGFVDVTRMGKYHFEKEMPTMARGKFLFITTPGGVPDHAQRQKTFFLKNGNPALVAYTL